MDTNHNKRTGLIDTGYRVWSCIWTANRNEKAWSTITHIIHWTYVLPYPSVANIYMHNSLALATKASLIVVLLEAAIFWWLGGGGAGCAVALSIMELRHSHPNPSVPGISITLSYCAPFFVSGLIYVLRAYVAITRLVLNPHLGKSYLKFIKIQVHRTPALWFLAPSILTYLVRMVPPQMKCLHLQFTTAFTKTVELHSNGLIATASYPDLQQIRIIGFFFENRLHWHFEVRLLLCTVCICVQTFRPRPILSSGCHNTVMYVTR
jgi:hypothetical protein